MRIAFFGSSLLSAYWNGAATYYRGILKALAARGHEVVFLEPDAFDRQRHRDIEPPDWARVVVYAADPEGLRQALGHAGNADLVVKASGVGVLDAELEAGVLEAASADALVAFWDVDAPATLARLDCDPQDPLRALLPEYDLVLTYGGGAPVRDAYLRLGARLCAPIYNALDPDDHYPVPPEPRFACDLAFLGNRLPDREARVEAFFLTPATAAGTALPARRQRLGWQAAAAECALAGARVHARPQCNQQHRTMRSQRQPREHGAKRLVAGDARVRGGRRRRLPDQRSLAGHRDVPRAGREVLVAEDGAAVVEILRQIDEPEARRIGAAARQRVLAEHTYRQRALAVEDALSAADRRSRPEQQVA
jgi:spore maturation protein CgeB